MEKMYISYTEVHKICIDIVNGLKEEGWIPDAIVMIGRAGFVPGTIMSKLFNIRHVYSVGLIRYLEEVGGETLSTPEVLHWLDDPKEQIGGKKILLVDEVDDHGTTGAFCTRKLLEEEFPPAELRFAVLHNKEKEKSSTLPENVKQIIGRPASGDPWIMYPWDALFEIDEHNERVIQS